MKSVIEMLEEATKKTDKVDFVSVALVKDPTISRLMEEEGKIDEPIKVLPSNSDIMDHVCGVG